MVEIDAKGKTELVRAFAVVSETTSPRLRDKGPSSTAKNSSTSSSRRILGTDTTRVSGFYIIGEAGIGKTRLIQALADKIRLFPDF